MMNLRNDDTEGHLTYNSPNTQQNIVHLNISDVCYEFNLFQANEIHLRTVLCFRNDSLLCLGKHHSLTLQVILCSYSKTIELLKRMFFCLSFLTLL